MNTLPLPSPLQESSERAQPGSSSGDPYRREFLVQAASMLGVAVSAGAAITLLNACETTTTKPLTTTVPGTNANTATINVAQESALQAVGGAVIKGLARTDAARDLLIIRTGTSQFLALSAVCTHAQCTVGLPQNNTLTCPCHGSRFSATNGSVLGGPAAVALKMFAAAYDAATMTLTVTFA